MRWRVIKEFGMEDENQKQSKLRSVVRTIIPILGVDIVLVIISWRSRAALFFLGILVMIIGYFFDYLFFGSYVMKGRRRGRLDQWYLKKGAYPSSSKEKTEFDQYKVEEGDIQDSDLDKEREHSISLLNVSFAGAVAIILSFILPWLS